MSGGTVVMLAAARTQLAELSEAGIRVTLGDPVVADRGPFVLLADRPTLHRPDPDGPGGPAHADAVQVGHILTM